MTATDRSRLAAQCAAARQRAEDAAYQGDASGARIALIDAQRIARRLDADRIAR